MARDATGICAMNRRSTAPVRTVSRWACVVLLLFAALAPRAARAQAADVPYVPTPMNVVDAMLDIAKVGPDDFLIDLGSGDGRIVITAARKYGARGFGVDLDGALVSQARRDAERQGVRDRADFYARNLFITDIDQASVLTAYLLPQVNLELRPRLFRELKPGTRVVSHDFDFGKWQPDAHVRVAVPNKPYGAPSSEVYLWIVPANAAGRWRWRVTVDGAPVECEVALEQTFQMVRAARGTGRNVARVESAKLRGADIALAVLSEVNGREVRQELTGRVAGDTIRGVSRIGSGAPVEWQATRAGPGTIDLEGG